MPDHALLKRLKALQIFRAFFVTFLLGTFLFFEIGHYKFPYPNAILYLILSLYLLTLIYTALLHRVRNLIAFAYIQMSVDALSAILLIFFTGGIESWFSSVMLLTVISSVIIIDKRAGYIIASLCSLLYGLMIDSQFYGIIPTGYSSIAKEKDFLYNVFSHISALYITAYLTGYLSSRLEKTSKSLEEKVSDLNDLTLFNRELIENLPSGLLTTDVTGRILIFNRAAESITGIRRTEALQKNISDIFGFLKYPFGSQRIEGTISNGGKRIIGLTVSETMNSDGLMTGYICIFQDITQLKKLEAELKHHETLSAIGELSANMAHEIRNPLASLRGSIEMLREGALTKENGEKLMNIAISEMDRLNKIITDFLMFSRPMPPDLCIIDLHSILAETVELISGGCKNNNITIKKDFSGRNEVVADPQKLRQVFLNLGLNAIDSMPEGGDLTIRAEVKDETVKVFFKDSGIGIRPENLNNIFYPFFTTKSNGTGLGLSIAYRIVEEHNGKISVRSIPQMGTTFEIELPRNHPDPSMPYKERSAKAASIN